MKKILAIILILGITMFTSLLNAFGLGEKDEIPTMYSRQINLSGNIVSFKIPEDFSRNMPAEDLIEQIDLENSSQLRNEGYVTLMRRWWDIKEPGFFGKDMGTIMMSINVRKTPENQAGILKTANYDFHEMLHFIVALYDSLEQRHREHNKETIASGNNGFSVYVPPLVIKSGETLHPNYEKFDHGRTWITTGTGIYTTGQINHIYAIPINPDTFFEIEFSLMPNENIIARDFINLAKTRVNAIADTFILHYASGNEFDTITSSTWSNKTLLNELKTHHIQLFDNTETPPQLEGF